MSQTWTHLQLCAVHKQLAADLQSLVSRAMAAAVPHQAGRMKAIGLARVFHQV